MAIYNMIYVIFILLWANISSSMTWNLSNVPIPVLQNKAYAFIGYYNQTVQILGGGNSQNDRLEFPLDVEWNTSETTSITFGVQGSQSSIQIDEQLWMLPYGEKYLKVYDLAQKSIIKTVSFPGTAIQARCVTSYNEYIFIIGGYLNIKEFHIYNRNTTTWSTGTSLNNGRRYHSCNVVQDIVYIIGGDGFDSIEYMSLPDNGTWIQMNDTLSSVRSVHRSVVFEEFIYVIGGFGNGYIDQVDIINTISKTISYPPTNKLVYAKRYVSAIVVENVIYVFGGQPSTDNIYYQYASIPTLNRTQSPTNPTYNLTQAPTVFPSNTPTNNPTSQPTSDPTNVPTHTPTISSNSPSEAPTRNPTQSPTNSTYNPTVSPSDAPSYSPYNTPTNNPTSQPTVSPYDPTSDPTYVPSITTSFPSISPTYYQTLTTEKIEESNVSETKNNLGIIIGSIIGIIALIVLIILLIFVIKAKQNKQKPKADNIANNFSSHNYNIGKSVNVEMKQLPVVMTAFGSDTIDKNHQTVENDNDIINTVNTIFDSANKGNENDTTKDENVTLDKDEESFNSIDNNTKEYQNWGIEQVYEWIMHLNEGTFQIYGQILLTNLTNENVDGACLRLLNEDDLHRLGINQLKHKKLLLNQIEKLTQKEAC